MKQLCLLFLILLPALGVDGQKIRFTDTTNRWDVQHTQWGNLAGTFWEWRYSDTITIDTFKYFELGDKLIREDTINERFYVRAKTNSPYIDTLEQVLYDFNLKTGDTIIRWKQKQDTNRHYVAKIDSVLINGVYHKLWQFDPLPNNPVGQYSYIVIEGIGSMGGPLYPLNPVGFEQHYRLTCFKNSGSIITVPTNNSIPSPYNQQHFLSLSTCLLAGVDDAKTNTLSITISPHPANTSSVITLPYALQRGELTIYNTMGQTMRQVSLSNTAKVSIGQLPNAGVYYYYISDKTNGQLWQGKLVYSF